MTGGAGYLGSVLVPKLLESGLSVRVFDNFTYGDAGLRDIVKNPELEIIEGDIQSGSEVQNAVKDMDCIIHLAAISNDPSAELDPALTRKINYDAYPIILNAGKNAGVQRFINPSSIGVYGINFDSNVTEKDPVNPLTEYARCKVDSELLVQQYSSKYFTTVSMRCGTVCGWSPRMRFDLSVNTLTAVAITQKQLTVWGGKQMRPQIHIGDITDFFLALVRMDAAKINGKIFNAAGYNMLVMETAEIIKNVLGNSIELICAPPRNDERSYHVNSDRIGYELGLVPRRSIEDAVRSILEAYEQKKWVDHLDPAYNNVIKIKQDNPA